MFFKLIASDVDGTLIDDQLVLSDANIAAIQKARDHGIRVVLCSGRSPGTMLAYEKQLGLVNDTHEYGIGFNGAVVYRVADRQVLAGQTIPQATIARILETVRELSSDILLGAYLDSHTVIAEDGLQDIMDKYSVGSQVTNHYYPKLTPELFIQDPLNLYLIQYRDKLLPVYEAFTQNPIPGLRLAFSQEHLLEFMPERMDKAQGLKMLAQRLGIDMAQVVAVGDNYNDIEMVQAAGYGFAVANAVPELKQIADHVTSTTNNQSALVEVVEQVIALNQRQ